MDRKRRRAEVSAQALAVRNTVLHVGQIRRDLDHVIHVRAVCGEHPLDLVEGIVALRDEIVVMANVAARPVLILRADAGEENHRPTPEAFHGDGLGEDALGPGAVVELLLLEGRRGRLLCRSGRNHETYDSGETRDGGGDERGETSHRDLQATRRCLDRIIHREPSKAASPERAAPKSLQSPFARGSPRMDTLTRKAGRHSHMRRREFLTLVGGATAAMAPGRAAAQVYPTRPVTLVIPFPPGGG